MYKSKTSYHGYSYTVSFYPGRTRVVLKGSTAAPHHDTAISSVLPSVIATNLRTIVARWSESRGLVNFIRKRGK